tara:strand:- start:439 stop:1008 length:570 start_codon:yes stop_codon:yes gene_type:complete
MNINTEELLIVIVAFLIGLFLSQVMRGGLIEGSVTCDDTLQDTCGAARRASAGNCQICTKKKAVAINNVCNWGNEEAKVGFINNWCREGNKKSPTPTPKSDCDQALSECPPLTLDPKSQHECINCIQEKRVTDACSTPDDKLNHQINKKAWEYCYTHFNSKDKINAGLTCQEAEANNMPPGTHCIDGWE